MTPEFVTLSVKRVSEQKYDEANDAWLSDRDAPEP